MNELSVESLAGRVEALENALASARGDRPSKDWRRTIGMFGDSEFMRKVDEDCRRIRETEREAARREAAPG